MEQSRLTSPYYESWIATHAEDLKKAVDFVHGRDFHALAELAEYNCLKMHSVMMTTRPSLMYWTPTTLACMQKIMKLRANGVPVFFTIDAGPQVKAVCLPTAEDEVSSSLQHIQGVLRVIAGKLGEGARLVDDSAPRATVDA